MEYLSTKQFAERWGITTRRITILASQGRIKGAKQIDGRWFLPKNAEKPADPRKTTASSSMLDKEIYFFPMPLVKCHSNIQAEDLNSGEKELFHLSMLVETGNLQEARTIAESLLSSENLYVRLGALYHLPMLCMYLSDYQKAEKYTILFRTAICSVKEHKAELEVLLNAFDSEMKSISEFADAVDTYQFSNFPDNLMPYIAVQKIVAEMERFAIKGRTLDFSKYEILCRLIESQGYAYCSMMIHAYLSMYYGSVQNMQDAVKHLESATQIAISCKYLFTLAFFITFIPEISVEVLSRFPSHQSMRILELAKIIMQSRNSYFSYRHRSSNISRLTEDEQRIISLCMKDFSVKDMATVFFLSESGMKKRLAMLYAKLGVNSKHELVSVYLQSTLNWGIAKP